VGTGHVCGCARATIHPSSLFVLSADAVGEDAIVEWYHKAHSQQGKSAFLEEMKPFADWLASAEVEDETDSNA
jgi:hypothetical protein